MTETESDELMKLLKEHFWYEMSNVHTSFPGVVKSYDPKTRRADIQPSLKRLMPNGEYMALPVLCNVPVRFPGTKKYTIHIMLEEGDEVEVSVSERSTDKWRTNGGKDIEDEDTRRFSIADCYCSPGLQPVEFIPATAEKAFEVIHQTDWNGDIIDHFVMDDDQVDFLRLEKTKESYHYHLDKDKIETTFKKGDTQIAKTTINDSKVETLFKEKATVLMEDDHIQAKTEKCTFDIKGDVAELKNSQSAIKANAGKVSVKNSSQSLFTILDNLLQELISMKTVGSPANHAVSPDNIVKFTQYKTNLGLLMEA
jgi:hypothetical protein